MKNKKLTIHDSKNWIRRTVLPNAVIFDGPDGCGKSTIAKEFAKRHTEFDYFKLKKDKIFIKNLSIDVIKLGHELEGHFLISLIKHVKFHVVFDRQYPSEICYGRAFRIIDEKYWKAIDSEHSKLGTKIIICIKKIKRKDDLFNSMQVERVEIEYRRFAKETKCDVLILDTDNENLSEQLNKIDNFVYDFNHDK